MTDVPPPDPARPRRQTEAIVVIALALVLLVTVVGLVISAIARENDVALSNLALLASAIVGLLGSYVGVRAVQKAADSASNTTTPPPPTPPT